MRNRLLLLILALAWLPLASDPAVAQPKANFQFALNDATGTPLGSTVQVTPGTFTWRLYLVDAGGATAPFLNSPTNNPAGNPVTGLSGSAVTVASGNPAALIVNSNPPPPVLNTGDSSVTPTAADASGNPVSGWQFWSNNGSQVNSIHLNVGRVSGATAADSTGRILLGFYSFTATAALGATPVTLTASDANPTVGGDTTYAGNGASLDASIGNGSLTVTAVPEPGSMLLCGLGAVGLAAYRRRTRKQAVVEEKA